MVYFEEEDVDYDKHSKALCKYPHEDGSICAPTYIPAREDYVCLFRAANPYPETLMDISDLDQRYLNAKCAENHDDGLACLPTWDGFVFVCLDRIARASSTVLN